MSASLMFYEKPVLLDKVKHKHMKIKKQDHLNHAKDINSVPLSGGEFFGCSRNHPVMFAKNGNGDFFPIALLSLTSKGHNLGERWENVYVPFFVRRYPFALEASKSLLIFDEKAPHIQKEEGEPLFDADGEPTQVLKKIMHFLKTVDLGYELTAKYATALKEKGLIEPYQGKLRFSDTTLKLDHMFVVNEEKFYETLTDDDIVGWFKKGWLAWTHAHLHSISALSELVNRLPRVSEEHD